MISITDIVFNELISTWGNFYMLAGSAAATLMGLIFVSVSLHLDLLARAKESADIRVLARWTFSNFIMILSFAFIFLIPESGRTGIGEPLLFLGVLQLARTALLWREHGFKKGSGERMLDINMVRWSLLIPNTVCYLAVIYIAAVVLQGGTEVLYWMVLVIVYLTLSATMNTWSLMMKLAEIKNQSPVHAIEAQK